MSHELRVPLCQDKFFMHSENSRFECLTFMLDQLSQENQHRFKSAPQVCETKNQSFLLLGSTLVSRALKLQH